MFDDLKNAVRRLGKQKFRIIIPTDAEGYYDRECPAEECLFGFKIHEDDWESIVRDEEVFCPFCKHAAPSDNWFTDDQLEYIQQAGVNELSNKLHDAMKLTANRWNRRQPRNSALRLTFSAGRKPQHYSLPDATADLMQLKIQCQLCHCRYAVIGAAYFCPSCGHNSADQDIWRSLDTISKTLNAISQIRAAISDVDDAENITRSIVENCLLNTVTAFQRFVEVVYQKNVSVGTLRRNAFQNIYEGSRIWKKTFGKDYSDHIGKEGVTDLNRLFQQRHLLAHKDGIVDADYINNSQDTKYEIGQRIVVPHKNIQQCVSHVRRLALALQSDSNSR